MTCDLVRTRDGFDALETDWRRLLRRRKAANVFLTWEWVSSWWELFSERCEPWVLTVRRADGTLVGLAPFAKKTVANRHGLRYPVITFLGAGALSPDHLDLIVDSDQSAMVTTVLTSELASRCGSSCVLSLRGVSAASALVSNLSRLAGYRELSAESCPYVPLPTDWTTYRKTLSSKLQSHLDYCQRRLQKEHGGAARFDFVQSAAELPGALQGLFDLHRDVREAHGESGAFVDERLRAFHVRVATQFLRRGWLRLYRLRIDDNAVAWLYCCRYNNTLSYYQSGYDQAWKRYSPGSLMIAHAIRSAIEEGATEFDFLRGEEPYKRRWANHTRNDINLEFSRNAVRRLHHLYSDAAGFVRRRYETCRSLIRATSRV